MNIPSFAALLCTSSIVFPIQATPTLTPGSGYTSTQRSNLTLPGNTSLAALARLDQTSYGQVSIPSDTVNYKPYVPVPAGYVMTPSVSYTPYFSDYLVTLTGFCAAADGTIRDGCSVRVTADGSDPIYLTYSAIDAALDNYRTGTRKLPAFAFFLKWTAAMAAARRKVEVNVEWIPSLAMQAQGMKGRIATFFMCCQADYDVKAKIDHALTGSGPTAIDTTQQQTFKSEAAFMTAAAVHRRTNPDFQYYAEVTNTSAPANQNVDISSLTGTSNIADTTGAASQGRVMLNGVGTTTIGNYNNQSSYTLWRPRYAGLDMMNYTFDLRFLGEFQMPTSDGYDRMNRFIRCEIHGGPLGHFEVNEFNGQICPPFVQNNVCLLLEQCYMHDMERGDCTLSQMIGCYMQRMGKDAHNMCSIRPHAFIATDQEAHGDPFINNPTPIMDILYSGASSNVYYTLGGANYSVTPSNLRTLSIYVGGTQVYTQTMAAAPGTGSGICYIDDLIQDINNNATCQSAGITARRNANYANVPHLNAAYITIPSGYGQDPAQGSPTGLQFLFSGGVATVSVGAQSHTDNMQLTGAAQPNYDNITLLSCFGFGGFTSTLMYMADGGGYMITNSAFVNLGFNNDIDYTFHSNTQGQIQGKQGHVILAHITQPSGVLSARFSGSVNGIDNATMDQFCRMGVIYCAEFDIPGATSSNMQGYIRDVIGTRQISPNPNPLPGGASNLISLGYPGTPTLYNFDTDTFPALKNGIAINQTPTAFKLTDFKPAFGSQLRLPQNLVQPWVILDGFGNPTNYSGKDIAGAVGLVSAAA